MTRDESINYILSKSSLEDDDTFLNLENEKLKLEIEKLKLEIEKLKLKNNNDNLIYYIVNVIKYDTPPYAELRVTNNKEILNWTSGLVDHGNYQYMRERYPAYF